MNGFQILNSGEVGNIGLKQLREQKEIITNKWEEFGLLEGLDGTVKENVAQLFENQASHMINETTTSDSSGSFETVAFPVIRRVFAKLLANEIVSVQALNLPIGRVYFINPKISKRTGDGGHYPIDGGFSNAANNYSVDSNGRRVSKTGGTQYESYSLYDAYYATEKNAYGDALFDRTSGKRFAKAPVLSGGSFTNGVTKFYTVKVTGLTTSADGKMVGPIGGSPMDTEEFLASLKITSTVDLVATGSTASEDTISSGSEIFFRIPAQKYGKAIVNASGELELELDLTYPGGTDGAYIALSGATTGTPVFEASYYLYSDLEDDSEIAEVTFDFDYVTVDVGEPKKLRATFTPEVAQDASAFHSINVEAELTALLSETVAAEIDRGILRDLRSGAAWFTRWDYNGLLKRSKGGNISRKDYNQELVTVINQISAQIQKSTLRGGANWIVVSPEVAAIFNDLEYFHVTDASPEQTKFSLGIEKIGALQNRYQVYVDVYAPANTILIGHKGDTIFHAGMIYCPYVPLMLMPKMYDYKTGKSVHLLMSRYAHKMINNRFYGKVYVDGIKTFGIGELR